MDKIEVKIIVYQTSSPEKVYGFGVFIDSELLLGTEEMKSFDNFRETVIPFKYIGRDHLDISAYLINGYPKSKRKTGFMARLFGDRLPESEMKTPANLPLDKGEFESLKLAYDNF